MRSRLRSERLVMGRIYWLEGHRAAKRLRIARAETRRLEDAMAGRRFRLEDLIRAELRPRAPLRTHGPVPLTGSLWRRPVVFRLPANDDAIEEPAR